MSRRTNYHYDDTNEDSGDDDQEFNHLRSKVKLLKTVSIQIGEETREHNKFLRQLDTNADSVWGILQTNMDSVKKLAKSGHNRIIFYLLAFVFFFMVVIYFINRSLH